MTNTGVLKILVLAHDLADAAVHRRTAMLRAGGAAVTVAGFRRAPEPVAAVAGCAAVDFGRTYNRGFLQRILSVLREVVLLDRHRASFANADIILARNLEMLAIAVRGRSLCHPAPVIIYECLDIHRLLLRRDFIGACLRGLEGWLAQRASALFTSSPAFVSGYFNALSKVRLPVRLIENKVLDTGGALIQGVDPVARPPGPVWKIGWFGVIRCRKSLRILSDLVRQSAGAIEVIIRGKPALDQFDDFDQSTSTVPGLRFLGPYKTGDLASMYREVHFTWAIDMFEEGLNSSWLLPNRLYEGGLFGSVPIAIGSVESGRFIERLGIGVTIEEPLERSLANIFAGLTAAHYRELEDAAFKVPRSTWVCGREDCGDIVQYMQSLKGEAHD